MSKLRYFLAFIVVFSVGCTERVPEGQDIGVQPEQGIKDQGPPWKDKYVPGENIPPMPDQAQPPWKDQFVPPVPDKSVPPQPDKYHPPKNDKNVPPVPDQFVPPVPDKSVPPKKDMYVPPVPDKSVPKPDQFVPTTNDKCSNAKTVNFSGAKVTIKDTTAGKSNEYGTSINCGSYSSVMAGRQAYYKANFVGGQTYLLTLAPNFNYARLYVFSGCGANKINTDCGSNGKSGAVSNAIYSGQTRQMMFKAPYSGTFYLAVDSSHPNYNGTFTLTLQKYVMATNTTCAKATQLKLTNKTATVTATTTSASNEFGTSINCKSNFYTYPGKQVYYKLTMLKGHTYRINLKPSYNYAVMYVFRSICNATSINNDCGSGGSTGAVDYSISASNGDTIEFKPTASASYTIAVDSRSNNYAGSFTLKVEDYVAPTNSKCTSATTIKLSGGKASVKGNTSGIPNEFGNQIRCGMSGWYALDGRQLYYKVALTKGKQYKVSLTSKFNNAYFYMFKTSCVPSAINADCASNGKTGLISGSISNTTGTRLFSPASSGVYYIAVDSTSTASSSSGEFTLALEEYILPTNGTCAKPQAIKLVSGKATVNGSTTGMTNEFGNQIRCGYSYYYAMDGPQSYYWLSLTAGQIYKFSLTPKFSAGMYVFGNTCTAGTINSNCGSNGSTGAVDISVSANQTDSFFYTPKTGGIHRIAVDSRSSGAHGAFTLVVEQWKKPNNSNCSKAQAVTVPANIKGDTTGATNEFGTAINCGNYSTIMRSSQLYYKANLTAGTTYTFKLSPSYQMARLYIFGSTCTSGGINADCGSGGKTGAVSGNIYSGQTGTVTFKPSKSAVYIFAVDGTYQNYFGAFTLTVN